MRPTLRTEQQLWRAGYRAVAGVDEVGRGAWAGPLVAAAVGLRKSELARIKQQAWFSWVADSKRLSPKRREQVFVACQPEVRWSVGVVEPREIDAMGISHANRRAVELAVARLAPRPDFVVVDYIAKLGASVAGVPARTLIKADVRVFLVALASIIAKVTRDAMMQKFDAAYPGYGFAKNKGYGTSEHAVALKRLGPTRVHRRSYRPVRLSLV